MNRLSTCHQVSRYLLPIVGVFLTIINSALGQQFYSQYQQDQYVYEHFFKDKENGVFVDIGAHDGITLSNTYFFEKARGWRGLCIEPIPEVYERLKMNRNCFCIQGCILDDRDRVPFLKIEGWAEMLSGIFENYDPLHLKRIEWEMNLNGGNSELIYVKCYDFNQLLLDHHIEHVDYLSIDTEGSEWKILQSINFSRIQIDVIEVENNYHEPFEEFLKPLGYQKIGELGPDELYKKID